MVLITFALEKIMSLSHRKKQLKVHRILNSAKKNFPVPAAQYIAVQKANPGIAFSTDVKSKY